MTSVMLSFGFESDSSRNSPSDIDNQSVPGAKFGETSLSPDSYFFSVHIYLPQWGVEGATFDLWGWEGFLSAFQRVIKE